MKTVKLLLVAIIAVSTTLPSMARTWRINPNPASGAEFNSVSELKDNMDFEVGDTILCDPGFYGTAWLSRENITLLGPGYLLNENFDWSEGTSAVFEDINVSADNITIKGVVANQITTNYVGWPGNYKGDNVTIEGCKVSKLECQSLNTTVKGCLIDFYIMCPITGLVTNNILCNLSDYVNQHMIYGNCTDCTIKNNTVVFGNERDYNWLIVDPWNCKFYDNVFIRKSDYVYSDGRPLAATGIIDFELASLNNCTFYNNVLSCPEKFKSELFPNNSYVNATIEDTFVWEGSEDAKFRLKENSPARGASSNGGDCGAYGGATPYVLSGVPSHLPRIVNASVPDSPTDGKIKVKLTIATRNE